MNTIIVIVFFIKDHYYHPELSWNMITRLYDHSARRTTENLHKDCFSSFRCSNPEAFSESNRIFRHGWGSDGLLSTRPESGLVFNNSQTHRRHSVIFLLESYQGKTPPRWPWPEVEMFNFSEFRWMVAARCFPSLWPLVRKTWPGTCSTPVFGVERRQQHGGMTFVGVKNIKVDSGWFLAP